MDNLISRFQKLSLHSPASPVTRETRTVIIRRRPRRYSLRRSSKRVAPPLAALPAVPILQALLILVIFWVCLFLGA